MKSLNSGGRKPAFHRPEFQAVPNKEVSLLDMLSVLRDSNWLIAASIALAVAAAAAYVLFTRPTFEAMSLIQIQEGKTANSPGAGAFSEAATWFEVRSPAAAEISILQSNLVLEQAIDRLQLDVDAHPKLVPVIGYWLSRRATRPSTPGFFGLPGYVTGNESIQVDRFVVPREQENKQFTVTLTESGYTLSAPDGNVVLNGRLHKREQFHVGGKAAEILVRSAVGLAGAEFLVQRRARAALLESLQHSLKIEEQGRQSGVLRAKLKGDDPERVAATLNEIGDSYIRQNVERKVADADKALAVLEGLLPGVQSQLRQTEQRLNRVRNRQGTFDLPTQGRFTLEQSRGLQATLLDLQRKRKELEASYLPRHPVLQALDAQINMLSSELANVSGQIRTLPSLEQELLGPNREFKVYSDLYVSLLNTAQQLGLAKESRLANIRVIDRALVPDKPAGPPPAAVFGFGATAGLVLGVVMALLRAGLRRGVSDPAQIESQAPISVLTTVPMSPRQRLLSTPRLRPWAANRSRVLATQFPSDPAVESLRNMRTLLPFGSAQSGLNIVVITGPTHSVGKSFISLNLAAVVGAAGARVLLVDGDLRKGKLAKCFELSHDRGFSDVLAGTCNFDEVVHREVMPRVDLLATGRVPEESSPADLLCARSPREVLKDTRTWYDMVIIDSPPVLAAADTGILSQHANAVFLVAKSDVTSTREIRESMKCLLQRGVHVNGVIFSGVDTSNRRNDVYGYSGYSYLSGR